MRRCFNPRPPLWDGRSLTRCGQLQLIYSFNPRPPLWDGRSYGQHRQSSGSGFQSTPALVGRALLCVDPFRVAQPCFNPRPPLWDGRSQYLNTCPPDGMFQSTPALVGRALAISAPANMFEVKFQSTPALVGRALVVPDSAGIVPLNVSIHARPCGTGARARVRAPADAVLFQSTPALVGRALEVQTVRVIKFRFILFQSTPALVGRALPLLRRYDHRHPVSIHARPCGTGARSATAGREDTRCFNPRPPLWDGRSHRHRCRI